MDSNLARVEVPMSNFDYWLERSPKASATWVDSLFLKQGPRHFGLWNPSTDQHCSIQTGGQIGATVHAAMGPTEHAWSVRIVLSPHLMPQDFPRVHLFGGGAHVNTSEGLHSVWNDPLLGLIGDDDTPPQSIGYVAQSFKKRSHPIQQFVTEVKHLRGLYSKTVKAIDSMLGSYVSKTHTILRSHEQQFGNTAKCDICGNGSEPISKQSCSRYRKCMFNVLVVEFISLKHAET